MVRNESILIKVSTEEKSRIAERAAQHGYSTSEYVRRRALGQDVKPYGKLLQDIARQLCYMAEATTQVNDTRVRANLVEMENAIWQLIK